MMHITVPETTKVYDTNGSSHDAFKIYINGSYHCTLRYSNLLNFHETLRKVYEWVDLAGFPPKKFKFFMSEKELEDRRDGFEFYLRTICQNPQTSYSPIVVNFFRGAQKDNFLNEYSDEIETHLAVYKLDGSKMLVHCTPGESTTTILTRLSDNLNLKSHLIKYFGLFIVQKGEVGSYKIVRWLQDFDCPSISLHTLSQLNTKRSLKIIVRKNYWDIDIDKDLINDESSRNLIYIQCVNDIESWKKLKYFNAESNNKWSPPSKEFLAQCQRLQEIKSYKEFIKACQMHPCYGFLYFEECLSDYPVKKTVVHIAFGNRQLFMLYKVAESDTYVEAAFRVNKIRCWKYLSKDKNGDTPSLSFEYLVARDHLEWITIYSEQSILLSLCLQSMVTEIVQSRLNVGPLDSVASNQQSSSVSPPTRTTNSVQNGSGHASASFSSTTSSYESFNSNNASSPVSCTKFSVAHSMTSSFDNEAFNTITDDDL